MGCHGDAPVVCGCRAVIYIVTIHSFQLLILTAFAHEKQPAERRRCLYNPLYRVVNAQFMRITTVNRNYIF